MRTSTTSSLGGAKKLLTSNKLQQKPVGINYTRLP